jgi:CRISPR-associated protein Csd1
MILQTLQKYYSRLAEEKAVDLPPFGFSNEKIGWAVEIDKTGQLLQVRDLRDMSGKRKSPRMLNVPKIREGKRTSGIDSNFLWDKTDYVFGVDSDGKIVQNYFDDFKKNQEGIINKSSDEGLIAVKKFLNSWSPAEFNEIKGHEEIAGQNIVFKLEGENSYIHERRAAIELVENELSKPDGEAIEGQCLITGKNAVISRLHGAIKGMRKPKSIKLMKAEFTLVGFNLDSFRSYNKDKNFNAPVGKQAAFEYVAALNHLLRFNSRQKMLIGDTTVVFWAEKPSEMEQSLFYLFNPPGEILEEDETAEKTVIDPDSIQRIRTFLDAIREGNFNNPELKSNSRFYILGLAPNSSRLSIRFWLYSTIGELAEKLHCHFRDIEIETQYKDEIKHPALWQLFCETAAQKKSENVNPLLGGMVMRALLTGSKYPESLLSACIGRIRAEQDNPDKRIYKINYRRMSLIKGCLIRNHSKEVPVSLDKTKTDVSYLLGRLFAIFEKAQEDAAGGKLNSTIKDRYFGSAMATPRAVFPILFRLNQHHVKKGEYGGIRKREIAEVVEMLKAEKPPAHLALEDQGLFAIGYYHQRNDFFKSHDKK